jgi:hypothetical protein
MSEIKEGLERVKDGGLLMETKIPHSLGQLYAIVCPQAKLSHNFALS